MHSQLALSRQGTDPDYNSKQATPLEVVHAIYAAYTRRDLETIISLFHPEGEVMQTDMLPWGGHFRGSSGLQLFLERLTTTIETRIEDEYLVEAGDQVVSIGRTRGRVRRSGSLIDLPAVHVYTISDGLVRRYEAYVDTPGMLRALSA